MKQPKCPWCGMGFRGDQSESWHVEGFREDGRCGSKWFPDFEGGHVDGRKQSEACREIVRLRIAHLRRMVQATCAAEERALKNFRICMTRKSIRYSIRERQIVGKLDRFRSACLAKITELKESQCSTKS